MSASQTLLTGTRKLDKKLPEGTIPIPHFAIFLYSRKGKTIL